MSETSNLLKFLFPKNQISDCISSILFLFFSSFISCFYVIFLLLTFLQVTFKVWLRCLWSFFLLQWWKHLKWFFGYLFIGPCHVACRMLVPWPGGLNLALCSASVRSSLVDHLGIAMVDFTMLQSKEVTCNSTFGNF